MSNNKTEQRAENYRQLEIDYIAAQSRLATLQAENEKLWKLLEEKVKFIEHETCLIENERVSTMEINKRKDRAWAAFQKANDLTENKK